MSPEAMQGGEVTERTDTFSYGVLLWEVSASGWLAGWLAGYWQERCRGWPLLFCCPPVC